MEEIKSNPKNIIFATLTFSEESLKKLEYDENEPNKTPQKAISLFRKRWWKKYKKPLKHWLITEMGHDNTKRIHLHGIIWTELTEEQFEKEWGYGWIFFGYEVNEKTINYIIKYITKKDENNPEFNGKIFTSKKIGISYISRNTLNRHRYQDKFTEETYRTNSGIKVALPTYYKQKIWTDQEREALRIIKEEKQVKYYNKTPIKVETIEQYREYVHAVKYWQSIKKYDGKRKKGSMQSICRPDHKEGKINS
nr:MAG TPA: Replication associated protein [Microviridae sp.]